VIVPQALNEDQLNRVREIVRMAVGFNAERGDAITVQPLGSLMAAMQAAEPVEPPAATAAPAPAGVHSATGKWNFSPPLLVVALLVGLVVFWAAWRMRGARPASLENRLSDRERQQLLREIQSLIEAERDRAPGAVRG
jgi:flagellar M-ring protein FliF